ncbi:lung adenoma susceptibility protein 2 [Girardinichthys multiradiatus]|uniref:lung adenoma susceptibility protein 2 n=1 Tax=Girardinichthys multiradiatus TaxID=208333 RepID=UPI001FAE15D0|nr:lung adenoma susceptibility protein 2 [Girardinichthys multiradiatus]
MESSSPLGDSLSPESTVTSLLSSSGHLRSSLLPPEPNTTFIYRDKNYDSASAALDAYITDFDRSCQKCRSSAGSLVLPHSQPSTPRKPRVGTLRNRDVLRERLTDRELDFLNLPVSSLHHRLNRDRISMTTDELLSIPYDGSMPVTHTSAFIQGLLSGSGGSQLFPSSTAPAHSSSYVDGEHFNLDPNRLNQFLNQNCLPVRTPRSSRCRGKPKMGRFHPSVGIPSSTHRAADLHLPHWLTSNKAHMDCSEISSLPDLSYPAWIQCCDVGEPELWDEPGAPSPGASRVEAPCWVSDLEKDEALKEAPAQIEGEQNLRDLRLQLAEQISALAAEGGGSHSLAALFRDNRIQALIQKADQVLDSLSSGGAGSSADKVSPVSTEDLLPPSPPPCPSTSLDPGAAELEADQTHQDVEVPGCCFHGNTTWKQPGPVEAVKQMLFRLQAVEAELQRRRIDTDCPGTPEKQEAEPDAELQSFPGSPSLQRALLHLNRLKLLVEEPGQKGRQKDEEKEEDEGRYSSLSADRLLSSQQGP